MNTTVPWQLVFVRDAVIQHHSISVSVEQRNIRCHIDFVTAAAAAARGSAVR